MQRRPRNCSRWASKSPKKVWKTSKLHWRGEKRFFYASGASFECYSWLLHLERLLTLLLLLLLVEGAMAWKWKCALEGKQMFVYASGASFECVLKGSKLLLKIAQDGPLKSCILKPPTSSSVWVWSLSRQIRKIRGKVRNLRSRGAGAVHCEDWQRKIGPQNPWQQLWTNATALVF